MSVIIACLFIAALLPILAKAPVAAAMNKLGGYDNNHPREQQSKLTGFGARALAAHQNSFESLILFAPAALLAIATNTTGDLMQTLAITHVVARVAYNILYLVDQDKLRTLSWLVATGCTFYMMWLCL